MSDKGMGRRTAVEITFEGVDITASILQYFKSMTYTDNEEDEADDLQIVLHDRDGIWMEKWLNDAVEAAASQSSAGTGLNIAASAGTGTRTGRIWPWIAGHLRWTR